MQWLGNGGNRAPLPLMLQPKGTRGQLPGLSSADRQRGPALLGVRAWAGEGRAIGSVRMKGGRGRDDAAAGRKRVVTGVQGINGTKYTAYWRGKKASQATLVAGGRVCQVFVRRNSASVSVRENDCRWEK